MAMRYKPGSTQQCCQRSGSLLVTLPTTTQLDQPGDTRRGSGLLPCSQQGAPLLGCSLSTSLTKWSVEGFYQPVQRCGPASLTRLRSKQNLSFKAPLRSAVNKMNSLTWDMIDPLGPLSSTWFIFVFFYAGKDIAYRHTHSVKAALVPLTPCVDNVQKERLWKGVLAQRLYDKYGIAHIS